MTKCQIRQPASIEPRFFKRGNRRDSAISKTASGALQSSHVFSNVETRLTCFVNGSAFGAASIEPRFFKRGNFAATATAVISKQGFNRATFFQTWKPLQPTPSGCCSRNASIEPRFFKRGNGQINRPYCARQRRFNRATFFQTWKPFVRLSELPEAERASIEPRFFKRGNRDGGKYRNDSPLTASIEPRFFKRGNLFATLRTDSITC